MHALFEFHALLRTNLSLTQSSEISTSFNMNSSGMVAGTACGVTGLVGIEGGGDGGRGELQKESFSPGEESKGKSYKLCPFYRKPGGGKREKEVLERKQAILERKKDFLSFFERIGRRGGTPTPPGEPRNPTTQLLKYNKHFGKTPRHHSPLTQGFCRSGDAHMEP